LRVTSWTMRHAGTRSAFSCSRSDGVLPEAAGHFGGRARPPEGLPTTPASSSGTPVRSWGEPAKSPAQRGASSPVDWLDGPPHGVRSIRCRGDARLLHPRTPFGLARPGLRQGVSGLVGVRRPPGCVAFRSRRVRVVERSPPAVVASSSVRPRLAAPPVHLDPGAVRVPSAPDLASLLRRRERLQIALVLGRGAHGGSVSSVREPGAAPGVRPTASVRA
jgi:hypothetical protein